MDDWDEEKLKEVVEQKHGEADKKVPKTNIVSSVVIERSAPFWNVVFHWIALVCEIT